MPLCFSSGLLSGVTLVNKGYFHLLAGLFLHRLGQLPYLGSVLLVRWRHMESQQVPQSVYRRMELGSLLALVAVIARPGSALWRGLEGPAVEDRRRRLSLSSLGQPEQHPQVGNDGLKAPSL